MYCCFFHFTVKGTEIESVGGCECNKYKGRARAWARPGKLAPEALFQLHLSDHRTLLSLWAGTGAKARESKAGGVR